MKISQKKTTQVSHVSSNNQPYFGAGHQPTAHSSNYIGMTLQQYFKIGKSNHQLQQIDQESQSSVSRGTPCFRQESAVIPQQYRNNRNKTQIPQHLLKGDIQQTVANKKLITLNLQDMGHWDKNVVKLPNIHDRHQSKFQLSKQPKQLGPQKKDSSLKSKFNPTNMATFLKNSEKTKAIVGSLANGRKGLRSRVTSTSFYHMNMRQKQRQRVKTQEEADAHLQKSFIITRYGALGAKDQRIHKYEQSFKLTKN